MADKSAESDFIPMNLVTRGFFGLLITNVRSKIRNSKLRIRNGEPKYKILKYPLVILLESCYFEVFEIIYYELQIEFPEILFVLCSMLIIF